MPYTGTIGYPDVFYHQESSQELYSGKQLMDHANTTILEPQKENELLREFAKTSNALIEMGLCTNDDIDAVAIRTLSENISYSDLFKKTNELLEGEK